MPRSIYRDLFFALSFHPNLSGNAHKVFAIYVTRHGYEGAWPSLTSLERLTGLSRKTIIKAKQELIEAGLIEVHESEKKSDLVFIPLLVEYFHQSRQAPVENIHQPEAVEFLPGTGVKSPPEVELLNKQDPGNLPTGGEITPACPHQHTTERIGARSGQYEVMCKSCNKVLRVIERKRDPRRAIR